MFYIEGQEESGLKGSKLISNEKVTKIRENINDIPMISKLLSKK